MAIFNSFFVCLPEGTLCTPQESMGIQWINLSAGNVPKGTKSLGGLKKIQHPFFQMEFWSLSIVSTVVLRLFCNLKLVGMGKSIILLILSAANPPFFGVLSSRKSSEAKIFSEANVH